MRTKNKTIFALDIGTRSIVGILLEESNDGFNIKDIVIEEHSNRAMLDGQIHNIPQVSSLVKEIKTKIEKKYKKKLKKVAVAAAGRSLRTIKIATYHKLSTKEPVSQEEILNLELNGAQKAQATLLEKYEDQVSNYYCVGYSVTKYYLDGAEIGSLLGQKGEEIGLEIVSAFLPKVVVDSLQTVLNDNKLELASITLEPIAAINAILPPTMRKLNIALVDVGAGTSDIAISSDGAVIAYGMVPVAGDEITEALCEKYLLDFNVGEKVKRQLISTENEKVSFTDILGFDHSFTVSEIVSNIRIDVEDLAKQISNEILSLNTKSPQAVILIGGGSLTPLLSKSLADMLGLSEQRVAVQKASSIRNLTNLLDEFNGPEFITPVGIGLTALKYITLGFIPVKVNKHNINMLNLGKNTVVDALLAAGIKTGRIYGKPGLALTIEVNGKIRTFPGSMGKKAIIKVNRQEALLDTLLHPNDEIEYIPAQDGLAGKGKIFDILPTVSIKINGEEKQLPFEITLDGKVISKNIELNDGCKVFYRLINQIGELLEYWKKDYLINTKSVTIILEGQSKIIDLLPVEVKRNNQKANVYDYIQAGDELSVTKFNENYTIENILNLANINEKQIEMNKPFQVYVNGEEVVLQCAAHEIKLNNQNALLKDIVEDGDILEVRYKEKDSPILIDIFPHLDFPLTPPAGKTNLEILINGIEAEYTTSLENSDTISLCWK